MPCTIAAINPLLSIPRECEGQKTQIPFNEISSTRLCGPTGDILLTQPLCQRVELKVSSHQAPKYKRERCECFPKLSCLEQDRCMYDSFTTQRLNVEEESGVRLRTLAQAFADRGWRTFGLIYEYKVIVNVPRFLHEDSEHVAAARLRSRD